MKDKIKEICERLNREQASVHGATNELFDLFNVVSCGRSGLYDLYNGNDVLICKGVNYKLLNEILGR